MEAGGGGGGAGDSASATKQLASVLKGSEGVKTCMKCFNGICKRHPLQVRRPTVLSVSLNQRRPE